MEHMDGPVLNASVVKSSRVREMGNVLVMEQDRELERVLAMSAIKINCAMYVMKVNASILLNKPRIR